MNISIFKGQAAVADAGVSRVSSLDPAAKCCTVHLMSPLCVHVAGSAKRKPDSTTAEEHQTVHKAVRTTGQSALRSPAICCAAEAILTWLFV